MQAIRTKFYGPTNWKGSRIIASCEAGKLVMPYNYKLDHYENHATAAAMLAARLDWQQTRYGGEYGKGDARAYYWVADQDSERMLNFSEFRKEYPREVAA